MIIDTRNIYPMSDFVRNHKAHIARLKETRAPEVLTVNGRAEVVVLDAESYERLMEQMRSEEEISSLRAEFRRIQSESIGKDVPLSEAEIERRHRAVDELTALTEEIGQYK